MNNIDSLVEVVAEQVKSKLLVPVEASGRHVHLSQEVIDILFGKGYSLTKAKDLSQPGQYACMERVEIVGPKGRIKNAAVLGPARPETQVEVSLTDARVLGVKPPVRESGNLGGSEGITIETSKGSVMLKEGLIVAMRHIHLSVEDAKLYNVADKELVDVKIYGKRPLIFQDVLIRVSPKYRKFMHIDHDEANACGYSKDTKGLIIKRQI